MESAPRLAVAGIVAGFGVAAHGQSMQLWSAYRDLGSSTDRVVSSQTDSGGNTYVLAQMSKSSGPDVDFAKVNSGGSISWTRPLSNTGPDAGDAMTLAPGGGAIFAYSFYNSAAGAASEFVRRYDPSGNLIFSCGPIDGGFRATAMTAASDGSVFVTGTLANGGIRLVKISSSGSLVWSTDIAPADSNGSNSARALALDSSAHIDLVGSMWNGVQSLPAFWQVDSSGAVTLAVTVPVSGQTVGQANAIVPVQNGPSMIAGTSTVDGVSRGWLAALDGSGDETWLQTTAGSGFNGEDLQAIALDPFGRVIVAGSALTSAGSQDFYIARFATDSTPIWSTTYNGPGSGADQAKWLAVDKWGSIFVGGQVTASDGQLDYAVLKLGPTGVPVWPTSGDVFYNGAAIYDGGGSGNNTPAGLGLDSRGDAFVGGTSIGPSGGYDLNVVKYGPTDNAAFVSQSVPTSMIAGLHYTVSVQFENTGNTVWTNTDDYKIGSQNASDNKTWGINRVSVPFGDSISQGQTENFTFTAVAPIDAGTYNFQWRMHDTFGYFGAQSSNIAVTVTELPDEALYVSQLVPSSVKAGSTFTVTVTMRNVGSNTWMAGNYGLMPVSGYVNWAGGMVNLAPSESIAHGAYKTFNITCTAPMTTGSYKMKWQMCGPNGAFNQLTTPKGITVTN